MARLANAPRPAIVSRSRRTFTRRVARGVYERHSDGCALSRGIRRGTCDCRPSYLARVTGSDGSRRNATFGSLAEAAGFVESGGRLNGAAHASSNQPVREPSASMTLEAAARWFLERALAGSTVNRSGKRYAEATLRSYETQLRLRVLPFVEVKSGRQLAELPLDAVTTRVVQALANQVAASASAATTRTAIAALQALMREAYESGMSEAEPPTRVRLPSPPKPRQRVLRAAEVDQLLAAARADDARLGRSFAYPLFRLMSRTGGRVSELLQLDWGPGGLDLDATPPVLRIDEAKTEAGVRDVWLDADTAAILRAHREASKHADIGTPVFRRRDGQRAGRSGITRACVDRVAAAVGVRGVSPHVFRHTHVTELVAGGASIVDVAARVGHADPRHTLALYAKPTDAGQARIVRLLSELAPQE
jgi:integrase